MLPCRSMLDATVLDLICLPVTHQKPERLRRAAPIGISVTTLARLRSFASTSPTSPPAGTPERTMSEFRALPIRGCMPEVRSRCIIGYT
jgi:hypothetical protein